MVAQLELLPYSLLGLWFSLSSPLHVRQFSLSDWDELKQIMLNCQKLARTLHDDDTILVFDQAIYQIAYTIRSECKEEFKDVILILGGFHLGWNFIKALCKIYRDAGCENLLSEANVCLPGTAKKIFSENCEYYQTVHALKIVYDTIVSLQWEHMEQWCIESNKDMSCITRMNQTLSYFSSVTAIKTSQPGPSETNAMKPVCRLDDDERNDLLAIQNLQRDYKEAHKDNENIIYWLNFIEAFEIFLRYEDSFRASKFEIHLQQARNMLPYLVVAGHTNYQVSLPLYLHEMINLAAKSPSAYRFLCEEGNFAIQQKRGKHKAVPGDMIMEQTFNSDLKGPGGIKGIQLDARARQKHCLLMPIEASIAQPYNKMISASSPSKGDDKCSQQVKDTNLLIQTLAVMATNFINPLILKISC